MNVTVIPAEPGYFILAVDSESGELVKDEPVLAWECTSIVDPFETPSTNALPVTLSFGTKVVENGDYVLYPDGRVCMVGSGHFENLTEANYHVNCNIRICGDPQEQFSEEW